jgi:hypothetical protein
LITKLCCGGQPAAALFSEALPRKSSPKPTGKNGRVRLSFSGKRMAMKKRMTSTPHDAVFKRFLRHPETANDFSRCTCRSDPPAV